MATYSIGDFGRREILKMSAVLAGSGALFSTKLAAAEAALLRTPGQILGPFYPLGELSQNSDLTRVPGRSGRAEGPVLNVMGQVLNLSGEPVRTAKVEVWQANAEMARVAVHAPVRQAPGALAGADHPQAIGYDLVKVDPTGRLLAVWISFSAATTTRAYSLHRRRRRSL